MTVAAAVWLGVGFVLQQRAAQREAKSDRPLRLMLGLLHRPIWILGVASMVTGQALSAWALGHGDLSFVEPILATNLVVALLLAVPLASEPVRLSELAGAVLLSAGVVAFTLSSGTRGDHAGTPQAWVAAAGVGGTAALLVLLGWRRSTIVRAGMVGAAAGLIFGVQDALTRRSVRLLTGPDPTQVLTRWQPYALVAAAVVGIVLMQDAFSSAPLHASLPAITAAEPMAGILLGIVVFGDTLRNSVPARVAELLGLAAMVVGVVIVARAPALSGPHHHHHHAQGRQP